MNGHRGTAREYGIARLRRDAPDLHARVEAGELSVHAAMTQAGFAQRRFTVLVDTDAQVIARTLRRNLSGELLAEVMRLCAPSPEGETR